MLAILQERMLGVIRHLTHTFNIFLFFLGTLLSTWSHVFGQCYNHSKNCCLRGKSQDYMYRIFKLMCAKYQIEKAILQKLIYINVKKTVMMAQHSSRHCMQVLSQQTGCSTWMFPGLSEKLTPVGFEPTPLRTGAWSQRLRPLGQSVHVSQDTAAIQWKTYWWLWLHDCLRQQMTFWCLSCACCGHGFWPYSRKACSVSKLISCTKILIATKKAGASPETQEHC